MPPWPRDQEAAAQHQRHGTANALERILVAPLQLGSPATASLAETGLSFAAETRRGMISEADISVIQHRWPGGHSSPRWRCCRKFQESNHDESEIHRQPFRPIAMASKNSESQSPILKHILDGGSSVSYNLIRTSQKLPPSERMFSTPSLNNIILFKYPNFTDQSDPDMMLTPVVDGENDNSARPIETALYIPHDVETALGGGYAIYLRAKNYEDLLGEHFGIDMCSQAPEIIRDLKILNLIDDIPSMDAFLLKTCFDAEKLRVNPAYLEISEEEVSQLRQLIRQRIEPIVRKAIESKNSNETRVERFLEAIWNPDMPEAKLFVTAFGIDQGEAERIFGAWKGITFYEFQLRKFAKQATAIISWLKSKDCIPVDIRAHKIWEPQLLMYIEHVGKMLDSVLADIRGILIEYDRCFKTFMDGSPNDFRSFLRSVRHKYWLMGFCISSLNSVCYTYNRFMGRRQIKKLPFEPMQMMLKQFEVAANRRRERTTAF